MNRLSRQKQLISSWGGAIATVGWKKYNFSPPSIKPKPRLCRWPVVNMAWSAPIYYERGLFSIVVCSERVRYERGLLSTCMVCYVHGLLWTWSVMNVVCFERGLLWIGLLWIGLLGTGLLWTGLLWTWSVMNMVCYERVCCQQVCYERSLQWMGLF